MGGRLDGRTALVFGAADIQQAHSGGECVSMEELLNGARGLALGITRWCNGQ